MPINVSCDCGKKYRLRNEQGGKRVKCPACEQIIHVPKPKEKLGLESLLDDLSPEELSHGDPLAPSPRQTSKNKPDLNMPLMFGAASGAAVLGLLIMLAILLWPAGDRNRSPSQVAGAAAGESSASLTRRESKANRPSSKKEAKTSTDRKNNKEERDDRKPVREEEERTASSGSSTATKPIRVSTNVHAATLVVRDANTKKELDKVELLGSQRSHEFHLDPDGEYECSAIVGNEVLTRPVSSAQDIEITFDEMTVRDLCRRAVCLIKLPEGGFGSGFLFGDRRTIVTAAHVMATKRAEDVEIIFSPAEDEEKYTGAELIYFDGKQDVALLRLSEPVSDDRPFLWRMGENPEAPVAEFMVNHDQDQRTVRETIIRFVHHQVIVIGNPGRGGDYDPLYTRKAKIVGGRPDEFQIDIELKPGYSGGPVCLADTGQVAGLVSYKIVGGARYQDVGKSFAKSVALADDALVNWRRMTPQRQQDRIERLAQRFARQYGYRCAVNAGVSVIVDAAVYTGVCVDIVNDYQSYMAKARSKIPPGTRLAFFNAKMKKAHRQYIRERAPEKAKEVRDKVTPRLSQETDKWYQAAMADATLPEKIKSQLKVAYQAYSQLKDAAEQVVASDGKRGKDIDEFLELTMKWWHEAHAESQSIIAEANAHLE